ncbi:MAG TPA: hypothetical protein VGI30_07310, partial [Caulobacteraceae bacterium]
GLALLASIASRHELWGFGAGMVVRTASVLILFPSEFRGHAWRSIAVPIRYRLARWQAQLWPMQWKTLLNNFTGLITTRLLTPVILVTQGAVSAGRIGLMLALASTIVAATTAWPLSETALYAALHQAGNNEELLRRFRLTSLRSTALSIFFCVTSDILCNVLRTFSSHMADRLPSPIVIHFILATPPLANIAICFAIFIRARRSDPAVISNLLLGLLSLAGLFAAAKAGATLFACTYLIAATCFPAMYYFYFKRLQTPTS